MKKLKEKINRVLDTELRELFGRLSPQRRLVIAFSLFGVLFLCFASVMGYGLYRIGRDEAMQEMMQITPVILPDLVPRDTLPAEQERYLEEKLKNLSPEMR